MRNLAGRKDCDQFIRKELNKVNIPIVARNLTDREVPASIAGQLGSFWACMKTSADALARYVL
jgi:hypothetical protein